jgi:hypothetical protein
MSGVKSQPESKLFGCRTGKVVRKSGCPVANRFIVQQPSLSIEPYCLVGTSSDDKLVIMET